MRAPQIVGILNVTPDSFSDGGHWLRPAEAIERGSVLFEQGASIVDVGGESTRPGADRVDAEEERRRVIPVVEGLVERRIPVSVDTVNARTAAAAIGAGAAIINDVSGGLADPEMARVIADAEVHYIAMHWRGGATAPALYGGAGADGRHVGDVVSDVRRELAERVEALVSAGVAPERIILDPGLGFAKNPEHNWALLAHLPELVGLGHGVLVGASRKRFVGALLPEGAPITDRDLPTAVISALAGAAGAWALRVHDVASTRTALDVWAAWDAARGDRRADTARDGDGADAEHGREGTRA